MARGGPRTTSRWPLRILLVAPVLLAEFLHVAQWLWWSTFREILWVIEDRGIHAGVHLYELVLLIVFAFRRL